MTDKPAQSADTVLEGRDIFDWAELADELAEALRWHEDRRINPTSRGGPALAKYDARPARNDGSITERTDG